MSVLFTTKSEPPTSVLVTFDTTTPTEPVVFRSMARGRARKASAHASEAAIIQRACEASGYSPQQLAREGALALAKRLISRSLAVSKTPQRLEAAYVDLIAARTAAIARGEPEPLISGYTLRNHANRAQPRSPEIAYRTADRWLRIRRERDGSTR